MKAGKQPWVSVGNLRAGRPRVTHKAGHNKANCRCKVVCFAGIVNKTIVPIRFSELPKAEKQKRRLVMEYGRYLRIMGLTRERCPEMRCLVCFTNGDLCALCIL